MRASKTTAAPRSKAAAPPTPIAIQNREFVLSDRSNS
jgi:hypothetical protein